MMVPAEPTEPVRAKDLLDRRRRDHDAETLQLTDDALIAPPRILARKSHDQRPNICRDRWSA